MTTKRITQATFDEVVRENIEDLELEPEEAITDAIQQFEAQGVQLNNIVTDLVIVPGDSSWHPIINKINELKSIDISDREKVKSILDDFAAECNKSLAHRCLATANSGYMTLKDLYEKTKGDESLSVEVLSALCVFLNGQPDLVTGPDMELYLKLSQSESAELCKIGTKLIRCSCVMHETNRQTYVSKDVIAILAKAIVTFKSDGSILKETCQTLRSLTLDDDPRVPFGKAHEHAKLIVTEAGALELLLDIAKEHSDQSVLGELFTTIGRLAVRNEFCLRIMDLGGLELMLTTLANNLSNKVIATQIIGVLKAIAGNDDVKVALAKSTAPTVIVSAMDAHQSSEALSANACSCLATIALRNPDNCRKIIESQGHMAIVQCMKANSSSSNVQKQACMAIRNLVARTRQYCEPILALGTEELINQAMTSFPAITDECKAALRDLECNIELKERWTGEKGGLQQ